jgi:hypothetical protein
MDREPPRREILSAVNQLEPSRPIGANFPLSLLVATKLVRTVGIELSIKFAKSHVVMVLPTANQKNWSQMELNSPSSP